MLLERDRELGLLDGLVRDALAGDAVLALLEGPAKTELCAAGGRPRREALSGPESLTPSERRIADLAAEGHTNRDIAQTLYVTPRTVEGASSGSPQRTALADARAGRRRDP